MFKVEVFLVLSLVAVNVFGALMRFPMETEEVYGKTVKFCKYKGLRLLPRSEFKDYDTCMLCKCTDTGGSCATLPTAGSITINEESKCISVRIGCKNTWVRKNNPKKKCPKRLIPKNISMTGK